MGKATNQLFDENPEMIFTDRDEPRRMFWTKYDALGSDEFFVINYYGFGGIGKSRLCKYLRDTLQSGVHPVTGRKLYSKSILFSFEELRESCSRISVLEDLTNKLENECSFAFPLFKYALYVYYRTKGFSCDSPEIKKIQDNAIGATLLEAVNIIPVVGSIGSFVLKAVDYASVPIKELITKNSSVIQKLDKMSVEDIADELVRIFAVELRNNVLKESAPLVIFLDTYEQLQNYIYKSSSAKVSDEWLWGRIGLIRNIPNVLWVISGQRKLDWPTRDRYWDDEENLIAGEISEIREESLLREMLKNMGIREQEIIQVILDKTNGVPIHLSLCKDTYFNIKKDGRIPMTTDFDMGYSELAERFIGGLSEQLKDIIEFLACMEVWTEDDIVNLNLSADAYAQVLRLSFINDNQDFYSMHHKVQEVVYRKCSTINKRKYYAYACKLIDSAQCTIEKRKHLVGKKIQIELEFLAASDSPSKEEEINQFFEENIVWIKEFRNDYRFFRNFLDWIYQYTESIRVPDCWNRILGVYQFYYAIEQGEYAKAKNLVKAYRLLVEHKSFDEDTRGLLYYALGVFAGNDSDNDAKLKYLHECYYLWLNHRSQKELLEVKLTLCNTLRDMSKYKEARQYAEQILEVLGSISQEEYNSDIAVIHCRTYLTLGRIEWQIGTVKQALLYLEKGEAVLEEYKTMQNDRILYQLAAIYDEFRKIYHFIGRYDKELEYAKIDFAISGEAYKCLQSAKNYRAVMLTHFNLGKVSKDPKESIFHYNQAIKLAEELFLSQKSRTALHEYVDIILSAANNLPKEQFLAYLELVQSIVDQNTDPEVTWKDKYRLVKSYVSYYVKYDMYEEAASKLEELEAMLEAQKDRLSQIDYLEYQSWNYRERGIICRYGYKDLYQCISFYEKENAIEKRLYRENPKASDGVDYSDSCRVLASAYKRVKLYAKAFLCAREQLKIDEARAREYPSRKTIMRYLEALRIVTEYDVLQHRYAEALENDTLIYNHIRKLFAQDKNYKDILQLINDANNLCDLLMRDRKYQQIQEIYEDILRESEAFYEEFEGEDKDLLFDAGISYPKYMIGKVLFLQDKELEKAWQYMQDSLIGANVSEKQDRMVLLNKIEALLYSRQVPVVHLTREEGIQLLQEETDG